MVPKSFLSICSGIEAASVAFQPLGWEAVAFAEIEPFPAAVLAHHYPQVPNLGDMTRFREWDADLLARADGLCGGTPCQAFSVAGLRGSLDDERGNLTLTFCHLYDHLDDLRARAGRAPAVCLWENVPGVLSTADNAFGSFLAGLAGESVPLQPPGGKWTHAGYVRGPRRAVAWRVLDAQYFGLAQRRQRVFVVASADPAFDPAAVLFELDGLRRDSPPRREAGEGTAEAVAACLRSGGRGVERPGESRGQDPVVADCETRRQGEGERAETIAIQPVANCLTRRMHKGLNTTLDEGQTPVVEVTHALRGEGFDASEDGTGRGTPIVPAVAFQPRIARNGRGDMGDLVNALNAHSGTTGKGDAAPCVAYAIQERAICENPNAGPDGVGVRSDDCAYTLEARQVPQAVAFSPSPSPLVSSSGSAWRVRRLTPEECERLQGFPIGYTLIPGKHRLRKGDDLSDSIDYLMALGFQPEEAEALAHSPDGPRYKALGNSWAVPCARWIMARITAALDALAAPSACAKPLSHE